MSVAAHFSVTTAGALVLGGIAAIVLATAIALTGSDRRGHGSATGDPPPAATGRPATPLPAASGQGGLPETDDEYVLDTSD